MFKSFVLLICVGLLLTVSHCKKLEKEKCTYVSPPASFFFLLKQSGNRLPDEELNNLKISYWEGGVKKYVSDLGRAGEDGYTLGVMSSRLMGLLSADQNVKAFTLEYGSGKKEALYVDYETAMPANNCVYTIREVRYNSQLVAPDPMISQQSVYLLSKL